MIKEWRSWHYKNTTLLIASLIVFVYFLETSLVQNIIKSIGSFGYIGSFFGGLMFVSIFTVAPASAILFDIAKTLNPYLVALSAGAGAVVGDYVLLRFLKNKVFEELKPVFNKSKRSIFGIIFSSPFFAWIIPILGMIIIASPLPDEMGIGLIGLSKIKKWKFIVVTFALNSIGIFVVISLAGSI